jgi:ribonuclease P protein component
MILSAPVLYRGFFIFVIVKPTFTLGKTERLKSRKAIEELFKEGKRFSVTPFRICYFFVTNKELQFGVGVSNKNFKKAVDRNRVKRLTREAWRLQKDELFRQLQLHHKGLHVFFIYTEKEIPAYKDVFGSVTTVLQKLQAKIEQS